MQRKTPLFSNNELLRLPTVVPKFMGTGDTTAQQPLRLQEHWLEKGNGKANILHRHSCPPPNLNTF